MEEAGLSLEGQSSKDVRTYRGHGDFGYVFRVCDNAEKNCPRLFLTPGTYLHWSFADPTAHAGSEEQQLEKFRQVRDQIDHKIQTWPAAENY